VQTVSVGAYGAERSAPGGTRLISLWILGKLLAIAIAGDDQSAEYFGHDEIVGLREAFV